MDKKKDRQDKSILPLSGEKSKKKKAVKTTIVGGQPPGNERDMQTIPTGIEELLAMAAVDDKFAAALIENREKAIASSGVQLTPTEKSVVVATSDEALRQMIGNIENRIPARERRTFLKKSAAALLALVGGGIVASAGLACNKEETVKGIRPDVPDQPGPQPACEGIRPDRPEKPEDNGSNTGSGSDYDDTRPTRGVRPDRPPQIPDNGADTTPPPATKGIRPDRPRKIEPPAPTGIRPDRPKKPEQEDE